MSTIRVKKLKRDLVKKPAGFFRLSWVLALLVGSGYAAESEAPSLEFLEFLIEFDDVEDKDFDVLVFHAIEDAGSNKNHRVNDSNVDKVRVDAVRVKKANIEQQPIEKAKDPSEAKNEK